MNLNKVALYLEYIAFVLRKEGDSHMSKDKKAAPPLDEADPHGLNAQGGVVLPANGEVPSVGEAMERLAPKAQPIKKAWSSQAQVIARIERDMLELTEKQQAGVFAWFVATYQPESSVPASMGQQP